MPLRVRCSVAIAVVSLAAGCVPLGAFECNDGEQCDPTGQCEPQGYCSFEDSDCASGRRFSRYAADGFARTCVEGQGDASWWDPAWSHRAQLSFQNEDAEAALNGFVVLVVLNDARIDYAMTAPDGTDLRFVDDDGRTSLPFEIEQWDPRGTSYVWVQVPRIEPASTDDFVQLYYGNPDADLVAEPPWTEGFVGVWHMNSLRDSTANGNDVVAVGAPLDSGVIGVSRRFSQVEDVFDAGNSPTLADVFDGGGSASAWISAETYGTGDAALYGRIIDKARDPSSDMGYSFMLADDGESVGTLRFARGFSERHTGWSGPPNAVSLGGWHHVAVTYDATVVSNVPVLYVDGTAVPLSQAVEGAGEPETDVDQPLTIGNTHVTSSERRAFVGSIDEVRVARTLRTADWMRAEYRNGIDDYVEYAPTEILGDAG